MHAKSLVCRSFCIHCPALRISSLGKWSLWSFLTCSFAQIHHCDRSWYNHRHYASTGVLHMPHSWPFSGLGYPVSRNQHGATCVACWMSFASRVYFTVLSAYILKVYCKVYKVRRMLLLHATSKVCLVIRSHAFRLESLNCWKCFEDWRVDGRIYLASLLSASPVIDQRPLHLN